MNLKKIAKRLKTDIPVVFLSLKDKETPMFAKMLAGITVIYALSPIDLVPDFIPFFGYLDDLIILPLLIKLTMKFIPDDIWSKNKELAKNIWNNGKPKKWYYSIPIIIIWGILILFILKIFFFKKR